MQTLRCTVTGRMRRDRTLLFTFAFQQTLRCNGPGLIRRRQVGKQLEVIVDAPDPEVPNHVLARGHADAPEIDCAVRLKGKNLRPGDLVDVKITAADGYDLAGRAVSAVR